MRAGQSIPCPPPDSGRSVGDIIAFIAPGINNPPRFGNGTAGPNGIETPRIPKKSPSGLADGLPIDIL